MNHFLKIIRLPFYGGGQINTATLQVTGLRSSEWLTSSGYFCTERCSAGSRRLGSAVLENVLTCPVVDGVELEHRPGYTTGQEYGEDRELSEDDKYKWDYCSPAEIEAVVRDDDEVELGEMEAVPLPAGRGNGRGGNSGYNPGQEHPHPH